MGAFIEQVCIALPQRVLGNDEVARQFPDWTADKIEKKLGIVSRHILGEEETPADMAAEAATRLFDSNQQLRDEIDYLIFCTQSPDYMLPTNACILQDRLGLRKSIGAIDINQGCSGYVYGLGLAKGLIDSGIAHRVLLLTADGYSKLVGAQDASVRTIFGDAGTATVLSRATGGKAGLDHFRFGTDGSGAEKLIVRNSGMRGAADAPRTDLYMDGPAVLNFTLREVPALFEGVLDDSGLTRDTLDFVVLHQANKFIMDQLRRKLDIDANKLIVDFADVGNTVSSTIPIVLSRAKADGRIVSGQRGILLGFGVGLSWAGCTMVA